ncbi:3-phenylpropionate/cinnamic acid dioxygenase small subunit [Nocardia kruczakiae]|uniref:3-phenylpropionate/cinnamic acid dioxygenase small subunit n=1 Tax=Nocardia kruczakiae TaxID=261477 RepID=A0ABU1XGI0_9NOCA|nr:nuclear transport factor 2 family protein [Nocardia kruczakiae]MDR7169444.1 3-phenylpropionate/cinnamic acid dioxygenase small subunit [Nocardia kruczakiae]
MLSAEDRFAITDLINLHGHLTDYGDFDGWQALFHENVTYDVTALGGEVLVGLPALRDAALALGDDNPVAHHVTNIVLNEVSDGTVRALSKGLGVMTDGTVGSVTYEDTIERVGPGWKITHRIVRPRRKPLQP